MQRTKTGEFNWVDLSAMDMESQSGFYEGLLGWTHVDTPFGEGQTYRMFLKDGSPVAAVTQLPSALIKAGVPTSWNTYVAADSVERTIARAVDLGASVAIEPRDVPGSGRMAAIKDPTGAFLFIWSPLAHASTADTVYLHPGALSWTDLNTRDLDRAEAFYKELFGWQISTQEGDPTGYRQISIAGTGEGGMMPMPPDVPAETPSFWMPFFGSADVVADAARVAGLGGSVLMDVREAGGVVAYSIIADGAGAAFALMQPIGEMHW